MMIFNKEPLDDILYYLLQENLDSWLDVIDTLDEYSDNSGFVYEIERRLLEKHKNQNFFSKMKVRVFMFFKNKKGILCGYPFLL